MAALDTLHAVLPADAREDRQIALLEGENEQRVMTFRQLRQRAVGVLGALQRRGLGPGDAMVLYLGDNERFLEMFWACVLGGIVPVPLAAGGVQEHRLKLWRVFEQFERASICIDARAMERMQSYAVAEGHVDDVERLRAHAVVPETLDRAGAPGETVPARPDDLAFIQFSSGSTGSPKGVRLTHRNLVANIAGIIEAAGFSDRDSAFSWMPLSHDMGLIGFHLNMLACGAGHVIMRTELFARRPLLWLEEASRRRSTVLCSPNFGYQHYLRQYEHKAPAQIDLSAVRLIFNGAEPISAPLSRRFMHAMARHGLKPTAMYPVYGLAEASLAVTFPDPGSPMQTVEVDRTRLDIGAAVHDVPAASGRATELVRLGQPIPGTGVRIVGDAGEAVPERVLGHVEVRGDNVTAGYHRDAAMPERLAAAGGWLDTGDLGFLDAGQLVVAGRAKDVIFVNGQNVYPQDLEHIAEQVAGVEANRVVAAGVRRPGEDTEALALFVRHRASAADFAALALQLRRAVNQRTGLEVVHVVPVSQIPKTSSGKLQRYALAQAFADGRFDATLAEMAPSPPAEEPVSPTAAAATTPTVRRLAAICAEVVPDKAITPGTNLLDINLSSLNLARIHEGIEREYPGKVEITDLFDYPTLGELAAFLDRPGP